MSVAFAGLRAWAKGMYPLKAAVEILVRAFDGRFATPGNPWIQPCDRPGWWWLDVTRLIESEIGHLSGGEQRLLRIVASLAGGEPVSLTENVPGLDRELSDLVLAAIAHASGFHEHTDIRIDHALGVAVPNGRLPSLHAMAGAADGPAGVAVYERVRLPNQLNGRPPNMTLSTNPDWREQLTDLPLIREGFLVRIEQRLSEGASPADLDELRRDYDELFGRS